MDFLYWCSNTDLCQRFNEYDNYIHMDPFPRDIVIKGVHYIPGEPMHLYGGIYTLSSRGMLGTGITREYLVDACRKNHIFIVAIDKVDPLYPITDESIDAIQHSRILGCITANILNDRCIEIDTISSRSGYSGVGTNLMFKLLDVAKESSMNVGILNSLVSSMGFYMKFGFTYLGTDKDTPVFAVDLTKIDIQPPRLYLKRQSSNIPVNTDLRSLDEVEEELIGPQKDLVQRNIPMKRYIKEIGQLAVDSTWNLFDRRIKLKHGFMIPDLETQKRIKNKEPFMSKIQTHSHRSLRNRSSPMNHKYSVKLPTYLNKPLKSKSRSRSRSRSQSRSKRASNLV